MCSILSIPGVGGIVRKRRLAVVGCHQPLIFHIIVDAHIPSSRLGLVPVFVTALPNWRTIFNIRMDGINRTRLPPTVPGP